MNSLLWGAMCGRNTPQHYKGKEPSIYTSASLDPIAKTKDD